MFERGISRAHFHPFFRGYSPAAKPKLYRRWVGFSLQADISRSLPVGKTSVVANKQVELVCATHPN